MDRFDAIVVGAGPAGSVTAYRLATAGASVLLLDRARFPRDKPCGGGLTQRAVRQLPLSVDPVVEDSVAKVEFRLRYGSRYERESALPLVLMTQRSRLDAYLAEQAVFADATFHDGAGVTGVVVGSDEAEVTLDERRLRARAVVGADGANGVVARSLGLQGRYTYGVALEGNAAYGDVDERRYRGRAVLELGIVPGGYGWVFPKGDHVNVGVGGWEWTGPQLRAHLGRLCAEHGIAVERLSAVRGHRLPLRRSEDVPARGRALLVGDAAGLVDPLTGDGMYEAFVSGRLAAAAILDLLSGARSTLEPYARALVCELGPHTAASWAAKSALERFPRLTFQLTRPPFVWRAIEGLVRGDLRRPAEAAGLARAPLQLLSRLGTMGAAGR